MAKLKTHYCAFFSCYESDASDAIYRVLCNTSHFDFISDTWHGVDCKKCLAKRKNKGCR